MIIYERKHKWIHMSIQKKNRKVLMTKKHEHFEPAVTIIWIYFVNCMLPITISWNLLHIFNDYDQLTLSWGGGGGDAILHHLRHIKFYTSQIFFESLNNLWLLVTLYKAKVEGSSSITLKVTAFLWKVPNTIYVNPLQRPCKSVNSENDVTSSKT